MNVDAVCGLCGRLGDEHLRQWVQAHVHHVDCHKFIQELDIVLEAKLAVDLLVKRLQLILPDELILTEVLERVHHAGGELSAWLPVSKDDCGSSRFRQAS